MTERLFKICIDRRRFLIVRINKKINSSVNEVLLIKKTNKENKK